MPTLQKSNILIGTNSTIIFDGNNIGYRSGITISHEGEVFKIDDIDQIFGTAEIFRTNGTCTIKATLKSVTYDNIAKAWGITDPAVEATFQGIPVWEQPISFDTDLPDGTLYIFNHTLDGKDLIFEFTNVKLIPGGEINISKKEPSNLPITFESMGDDTGKHGYIYREM